MSLALPSFVESSRARANALRQWTARSTRRRALHLVCSALLALSAFWVIPSPGADDPLASSFELQAKGDLDGAIHACRRAADTQPKDYFLRLRLGYLELIHKSYLAAARDYQLAASLSPGSIEPLLGAQEALVAAGSYAEAEPLGRQVLQRDPMNYLGKSRLAWTLYNLKRHADSAKLYREILGLYPGDFEMVVGLGYAELKAGRKAEAKDAFRLALRMVPHDQRATAGLAAAR